jgi:hypothetical protein
MKARCNPFTSDRVLTIRYKLNDSEWEDLFSFFTELNNCAAIVGPKGTGKTTLLEDFAQRADVLNLEPVFWRQNYQQSQPSAAELQSFFYRYGKPHLICIDSAELFNWLTWRRIKKLSSQVGGLLVTAHSEGRLPTLIRCGTSPSLLKSIISELVPAVSQPTDAFVEELYYRNEGNIRSALRECYLSFANDQSFAA